MTSLNGSTPRGRACGKALVAALMASAAFVGSTGTAAAATCNATNSGTYDACVVIQLAGDTINLAGNATTGQSWTTGGILNINSGTLTDTAAFNFGPSNVALTVATGATLTLADFEQFGSLAGGGTINNPTQINFGFNNTNTAFSGTIAGAGTLEKYGTGAFTINGMSMTGNYMTVRQGSIVQSSGTTALSGVFLGALGGTPSATISGGTLNIAGSPFGFVVGYGNTTNAVVTQTAGVVQIGTALVAAPLVIGDDAAIPGTTTSGTYTISGGTLNLGVTGGPGATNAIGNSSGAGASSTGVLNISGTAAVNLNAGSLVNGDALIGGGGTTSSTINMTGGTLRINAGTTLYLSGDDNANAIDSTFNLNGGTLQVGGTGLQSGFGGGTGAYQFNMGTGTIQVIGSALTTSVNGTLTGATAATGTTIDTNGFNSAWNGVLSGVGWLVKTGTGTLNLGGVNTYTGGTAFNGGVVFVDALSDLGAASAAMSFNGGTLRLGAAGVLGGRTGATTMAGSGTIDTNGFSTIYDGAISGAGTLTKLGAGTLNLGGNNNAHTGGLNIAGGTLVAFNGNAIGNTSAVNLSGGSVLNIDGAAAVNETIGSLAGTGTVNLGGAFANTLTTGGNNTSTAFTGNINEGVAGSSLVKTGSGAFTVTGNLNYTGLTTVSAGSLLLNGIMADSLLIAPGATFGGNATINGNVTNNGRIAPGNSPGTVNILGNYTAGANAFFDMEVQFNNAGLPVNGTTHDFINITGNVTGTTLINVLPFAPSDAPSATTGNGIELVRVAGAVAGNQFALAAPVFQGPYQYLLTHRPNYAGALDGWFLNSRVSEVMNGEAAMFAASQTMLNACFRSDDALITDGRVRRSRGWAKVIHGSRDTGADTGNEATQEYTCGAGGVDAWAGGAYRVGISGGWGSTDVDVTTLAGVGALSGTGGMIQANFGVQKKTYFANVGLGYGSTEWTFDGPLAAPVDATLSGFLGSVQLGAVLPVGNDWRFAAIGEAQYDAMVCDIQCFLTATEAEPGSLFLKGTLRFDGEMSDGDVLPFISVSILNGDSSTVKNGAVSLTTDTFSALVDAKAGLSVKVSRDMAVYVSGGVTEGLSNEVSGWDGTAGLKMTW
ncbi:MAG: autotransporter-associated beta strand repeat-containing protein [Micropepsaceae bacterium]